MNQSEAIQLIELYKNYPLLYNPKDKSYRDKAKREEAWNEISASMGIMVPTLKNKMKTLMGTYRSEKSRARKSRISGSGCEDVYESKWFAFKYFDFLSSKDLYIGTVNSLGEGKRSKQHPPEPSQIPLKVNNIDSLIPEEEDVGTTLTISEVTDPLQNERLFTEPSNFNEDANPNNIDPMEEGLYKIIQLAASELANNDKDESTIFGEMVAVKIRKLTPRNRVMAQKRINSILFSLEMEEIDSSSSSTLTK